MRRIFLALLVILVLTLHLDLKAQSVLITNNIESSFDNRGYLFSDLDNMGDIVPGYEYPLGSGNHAIFTANYWLGGVDASDNSLYISAQTYPNSFQCYGSGPARDNITTSAGGIYYIDKQTVDDFIQNFGDPTYLIPSSILYWPGNDALNNGTTKPLAPYVDVNNNGVYDPANGDYPYCIGDQNLYFIYNDKTGNRSGFSDPNAKMEVEIENYVYTLENEDPIFKDVVFVNSTIRNKSNRTYTDFYAGLWFDFDIGFSTDDYMGSDSVRNLFYAYNGSNFDINYLNFPPAVGVLVLNQSLNSVVGYNNTSNQADGNPNSETDIYNLLNGFWKDGTRMRDTLNGVGTLGSPTKFLFQTGVNSENNGGSDKRVLGSMGPFQLNPEDRICIDYAIIPSEQDTLTGAIPNLVNMLGRADTIQDEFANYRNPCANGIVNSFEPELNKFANSIYVSNPNRDFITVYSNQHNLFSYYLYDGLGRLKLKGESNSNSQKSMINIDEIDKGIYFLKVKSEFFEKNFKVILE